MKWVLGVRRQAEMILCRESKCTSEKMNFKNMEMHGTEMVMFAREGYYSDLSHKENKCLQLKKKIESEDDLKK